MLLCYFIFKFKIKFTGSLNKRTSSDTVYVCSNMKISEAQNICFSIIVQYRGVALCGRSLISGVLLTTKTPNLVLGKRF